MRVLYVHNYYQQPGGEDAVFVAESKLLREHGHEVKEYTEDNKLIDRIRRGTVAARAIWSRPARRRVRQILHDSRFDLVHFHNTFPLISPSAYSACAEAKLPVVQTLHNYRLLCPASTFFRHGQICEACLGKTPPWPAVAHGCYRASRAQSASAASMLTIHRWLRTWQEQVHGYIALTEFAKRKFIEGGLPPQKIHVKPNFVYPDPGRRRWHGDYALFVGRLSQEKGIRTILRAWRDLSGIPLKIVGDGPLMSDVQELVRGEKLESVEILGRRAPADVMLLMKQANVLIFPSLCYETFGLVAVEAFACGVPVIASRLGAMAELVEEGRTGLLFRAGDPEDLLEKIRWTVDHQDALCRMGENARRVYEEKYTAEKNYKMLIGIYKQAINNAEYKSIVEEDELRTGANKLWK
jgi:glycosyltransferase involved in cell wall biosynthesis